MALNASVLQFYEEYSKYPRSYGSEHQNERSLKALEEQFNVRSGKIFENESESYVDFYETDGNDRTKFKSYPVIGSSNLKDHLVPVLSGRIVDPKCRFIFLHAADARSPLRISLRMMKQVLHYHQVMPSFLEHTFPFKVQYKQEDFHVAGFHGNSRIEKPSSIVQTPWSNRSGRQIEFSYNLKVVESTGEPQEPWRVRQCSIFHQFDLEWQRAVWIALKGSEDARDLIRSRLDGQNPHDIGDSVGSALKFSLKIHLEFCRWATENWHWHVNELENKLQESRRALSTRIGNLNPWTSLERGLSITTVLSGETEKPTTSQSSPWLNGSISSDPTTMSGETRVNNSPTSQQQQFCEPKQPSIVIQQRPFLFKDIQQAHKLEEKFNDRLLVLRANSQMVGQVKREYENLLESESCPAYITVECTSAIKQFARSIDGIISEFAMIQCRVEALLHLIQERKTLLYGILEYQNMMANRDLAEKSHESAKEMEKMTQKMHAIAEKTRIDTASMKTITTVTLFFLPGTFISTIMSTPIVTFKSGTRDMADREIGYGALKLFAVISVPLMILTFAAWIAVNWFEKRRAKRLNPLNVSPV